MVHVDKHRQFLGTLIPFTRNPCKSLANGCLFTQFIVFICVLFVLPTAHPVTQFNMNYAVVSVGGIFLIVGLTWIFWGRHHFIGSVHTNSDIVEEGTAVSISSGDK